MNKACIRGMALRCALGNGRMACVDALDGGHIASSPVRLDSFDEALAMRYYRIDDGAALFDPDRLDAMLPALAQAAVDEAGLSAAQCRSLPLFIGSSCFEIAAEEQRYAAALAHTPDAAVAMQQMGFDGIADRLRRQLGSKGPAFTWNTACSSVANALLAAQRALALGRWPLALVVGVELANLTTLGGFSSLQLIAEQVQPFDAARRGIVLGEGLSAMVLSAEPATMALPAIAAGATACDTHNLTGSDPAGHAIGALITQTLERAGIEPRDIAAIKAHATGTPSNDAAEAAGLHRAFDSMPPVCALKPWIGHTLGACGLNELVLLASALERGFVPATPGFENVDPALDLTPHTAPLPSRAGHYLLNQFGFGGNNTTLLLEWPC